MFAIRRIGKLGVTHHQLNELANALWLALQFLNDDANGYVTTLIDTKTSDIYFAGGVRHLAAHTPAWKNASFDAPDVPQ